MRLLRLLRWLLWRRPVLLPRRRQQRRRHLACLLQGTHCRRLRRRLMNQRPDGPGGAALRMRVRQRVLRWVK